MMSSIKSTYDTVNYQTAVVVSAVLGRIKKPTIISLMDTISFAKVFNAYMTLYAAIKYRNYITNEGDHIKVDMAPWNVDGIAELFDLLEQNEVKDLTLTTTEIESIRILRNNLGI